jgi:hypothetical protein
MLTNRRSAAGPAGAIRAASAVFVGAVAAADGPNAMPHSAQNFGLPS